MKYIIEVEDFYLETGEEGQEVLDQVIAWYAPSFHLHANPMKKKKFEPITKVQ